MLDRMGWSCVRCADTVRVLVCTLYEAVNASAPGTKFLTNSLGSFYGYAALLLPSVAKAMVGRRALPGRKTNPQIIDQQLRSRRTRMVAVFEKRPSFSGALANGGMKQPLPHNLIHCNTKTMITYILQSHLLLGRFLRPLRRAAEPRDVFQHNRAYLLGSLLLGLILPWQTGERCFLSQPELLLVTLQPITMGIDNLEVVITATAAEPGLGWWEVLLAVYWLG